MDLQQPFLSIIIPTFNSSEVVSTAIESILEQTFDDFEILIIDGQSQDQTIKIVSEIAIRDKRLRVISEPDKGIYDAMNKGAQLAKGEWLYFLGSDDKLFSERVLEEVFNQPILKDFDLVYGKVIIQGNPGWAKDGEEYDGEFTVEKLFKKNICHQAIFYRKFVFEKVGLYNINYRICADWDFNHRCFASLKTKHIDLVIAKFNAGGASTLLQEDSYTNYENVINLNRYYKYPFYHKFFTNYHSSLRRASMIAFGANKRWLGIRLYLGYKFHSLYLINTWGIRKLKKTIYSFFLGVFSRK